ncbi:MAG: peroxidase [Bacteroidetes bacterium HGW-Bacteroidetes-2]|jgi:uncharacterized peroxidase-related enzyme|nr:MAG: peroxidase [Bacteroidetes bacterium HGW-Bacteroidetes-2]
MSRIHVIQPKDAQGRLKEIYVEIEQKRGQLAEVHKIQSLRPESIVKHMDLYMEIMFSRSELSRAQREMIAVVVSVANQCSYCATHHGNALLHYWKDPDTLELLKTNFHSLGLSDKEIGLCEFAKTLTLHPEINLHEDITQKLKSLNFSDSAILDATLVVSYFNFVNRMVLTLGVALETDGGKNYNY